MLNIRHIAGMVVLMALILVTTVSCIKIEIYRQAEEELFINEDQGIKELFCYEKAHIEKLAEMRSRNDIDEYLKLVAQYETTSSAHGDNPTCHFGVYVVRYPHEVSKRYYYDGQFRHTIVVVVGIMDSPDGDIPIYYLETEKKMWSPQI